jgi:hypothetical protein
MQNYKIRVINIFWIIHKQKIRTSETNDELDRFKSWIDDVFATSLLERMNEIREYLMSLKNFACLNEKLRNHILYVQQVETYLVLKYVISRNDIDFLSRMFAQVILLFHESKRFNYQMKTLYIFWLTNTNACIENLKKTILVNFLMNIQRKKNKFFFLDLHLKLLNEYVKKMMKDRRISFMNLEYLFEYNARFATAVRKQFIWMKRFHDVQVNIKHSMINEFNDIINLTQKLRKKMIYRETRRISLTNQAKNLFFLDDKIMKNSIEKFNKKWIEIENSNATDDDEKLHCDMTNIYSNDAFDLYAKINEIDFMLAKRARMKTKMNVWSTRLRQKDCFRVFSCKLILVSFLCIKLFIFIRKTRFSSHSKTKMCWKKEDSRRISKRKCVEKKNDFRLVRVNATWWTSQNVRFLCILLQNERRVFILFYLIIKYLTRFQRFSNVRWRRARFEFHKFAKLNYHSR